MQTDNGKILLRVRPRGFCAGVVRAVDIVELALEAYGAPVYVHHEIVHNTYTLWSNYAGAARSSSNQLRTFLTAACSSSALTAFLPPFGAGSQGSLVES